MVTFENWIPCHTATCPSFVPPRRSDVGVSSGFQERQGLVLAAWHGLNPAEWLVFACLNTKSEKFSFKIASSSGLTLYRAHETQTPCPPWSIGPIRNRNGNLCRPSLAACRTKLPQPAPTSAPQNTGSCSWDREQPLANYHLDDPMANLLSKSQ